MRDRLTFERPIALPSAPAAGALLPLSRAALALNDVPSARAHLEAARARYDELDAEARHDLYMLEQRIAGREREHEDQRGGLLRPARTESAPPRESRTAVFSSTPVPRRRGGGSGPMVDDDTRRSP